MLGLSQNPVYLRESRMRRGSWWRLATLALSTLVSAGGVLWAAGEAGRRVAYGAGAVSAAFADGAILLLGAQGALTLLWATMAGASALTRERQQGTLEALLLTPLAPHEIILGKLVPIVRGVLVPFLPLGAMAVVMAACSRLAGSDGWQETPALSPVRVAAGQFGAVLLAATCTAGGMLTSALSRKTAEAQVRAGAALVAFGFFGAILVRSFHGLYWLAALVDDYPLGWMLVKWVLALSSMTGLAVALVAAASAALPVCGRSYARAGFLSAGAAYLSFLALAACFSWEGMLDRPVWLLHGHGIILSGVALGLCAAARSPEPGMRPGGAFAPFGWCFPGTFLYALLLSVAGLSAVLLPSSPPYPYYSFWNTREPLDVGSILTACAFTTTWVLIYAGFGCLVASRLRRLPVRARICAAIWMPVAVQGFVGVLAGGGMLPESWHPALAWAQRSGVLSVLALVNPAAYLSDAAGVPIGADLAGPLYLPDAWAGLTAQATIGVGCLALALVHAAGPCRRTAPTNEAGERAGTEAAPTRVGCAGSRPGRG